MTHFIRLILLFAHAKVLARFIVDDATGLMAIEVGWADNEIGYIKRKETVTIETARIALRQHERLGDRARSVDVAEVGPREETVVATGAEHEPA